MVLIADQVAIALHNVRLFDEEMAERKRAQQGLIHVLVGKMSQKRKE